MKPTREQITEMFYRRGPIYREICARLADIESNKRPKIFGYQPCSEAFMEGYRSGCRAVAAEIRRIDKPDEAAS